jgi:TonB family protein
MRAPLAAILLTSLLAPAAVYANSSEAAAAGSPVRITTGVVPPAVLNSGNFTVTSDALAGVGLDKPAVVLALKVNEKGFAENVRVVRSVNPRVDMQVLDAVRSYRFRPATLDQQPVALDLELTVVVQR